MQQDGSCGKANSPGTGGTFYLTDGVNIYAICLELSRWRKWKKKKKFWELGGIDAIFEVKIEGGNHKVLLVLYDWKFPQESPISILRTEWQRLNS